MADKLTKRTWIGALKDAAATLAVELPPLVPQAMGVARTETSSSGRYVTLKRRLVPAAQAADDGTEWTFWQEAGEYPIAEITFRQPLEPKPEAVCQVLRMLKGWLIDNWSVNEAAENCPQVISK